MNALPHPSVTRATRVRPADPTPVTIRLQSGERSRGRVEVISLTGGLLELAKPVAQGTRVKLLFVTPTGPVLSSAEMLTPISWGQQPFRFLSIAGDDQGRLRATVHSSLNQKTPEQQWIEKYRTTLPQHDPAPRRTLRAILAAVGLSALVAFSAIYAWNLYLR